MKERRNISHNNNWQFISHL